ncbi:S-layer homology domain-containing protein [Oscillibacter valericigenes]|uniref:S-layer homology domain-containing protein n=1 Tax=Oscillibacter valericigenes TaxID=351091 RepID=UPI001F48C739|nr:S-layer homology domain-containing protein [Oscillibacter valericigenes]MCF2664081.1 S-layer homology domain-containing protein [Oscillibacter valericigenes]
MKKRILSLLLAACMLVGLLPTAAFAAEPEEALYAQMLELGIVDADGTLIEDNTFTVNDGTSLSSLTELIEWLNECGDSDLEKVVTVDATGRSATVENLMYALLIEYQIAEVAGQLKLLASGENSAAAYATGDTIDTTAHDLEVRMVMSFQANSSVYSLRVNLYDKNTNKTALAPHDITVEVGMFADFLNVGQENYAADGTENVPGTNYFKRFTIEEGSSSITFQLDLKKLREKYLSKYNGLWDGNSYLLFQARTVSTFSRMPDSSDTICVRIAPSKEADPVVSAINGGTIIGMNNDSKQDILPYHLDWSTTATETVGNKDYFVKETAIPAAKGSEYGDSTYGWMDSFNRALRAGVGDANPAVNLKNVTIWTKDDDTLGVPSLSIKEGSDLVLIGTGAIKYDGIEFTDGSSALDYLTEVAKVQDTSWDNPNSNFYNKCKSHDWHLVRFINVEVPIGISGTNVHYPRNWYLNVDWIKQNDQVTRIPEEILMHGAMTIVDDTAPTIKSITVPAYENKTSSANANFYPGNVIPIVVTFTEPVYGDYKLVYLEGTESVTLSSNSGARTTVDGDVYRNNNPILSNTRVFYYTVKSTDNTVPSENITDESQLPGIIVQGVMPVSSACTDVYKNAFETNAYISGSNDAYQALSKPTTLLTGCIKGGDLKYSFQSMTATPDSKDPCKINFQVELDNAEAFRTQCLNWATNANHHTATVYMYKNGVEPETIPTVDLQPVVVDAGTDNERYVLAGSMKLDAVSADTTYVAELVFDNFYCYGIYATFTQRPVTYAGTGAYTISIDSNGWPSGINNTVFTQDGQRPVLSFKDNNTSYTYKDLNDVTWTVSDPNVVVVERVGTGTGNLTLAQSPSVRIVPKSEGTATITLKCGNNGTKDTTASNTITVTVKDNGTPTLLFAENANTFYAQVLTEQTIHFASNLSQHEPGVNDTAGGKITAQLYAVTGVDGNGKPVLAAKSSWTEELERTATSLTIPGSLFTAENISQGNTPSFILRLTATAQVDSTRKDLSTEAKILVCAQPAVITLAGLDNPMFTDDESIKIDWTVENFDLDKNGDACQFEFTIEKDGQRIYHYPDSENDEISKTGSYTLTPSKITDPAQLKDYYIVTAKAKNGTDLGWSIASSTITVYKENALDIEIGGVKKDSVTLKNEIDDTTTTTEPSGTTYGGETIGGLTDAPAIAKLRSELSLMESISINFKDYNWSILNDAIQWTTSTGQGEEISDELQRAVTINYREGMLYAPLENYSYTCYLPQTILLLSGLRDGSNTVTAQHSSLSSLSDSVTVNVETLKNKLYLFQFTPAVKTEVSYEDGLGKTHTVYTNDDGSLALFEPNGIASDLRAASVSSGVSYRGTISNLALKSGEGNGTRGELYPLNTLELRRAAVAQVQLLQPNGTPLANTEVTLRGGVYRNRYAASNRDDAYCAGAKFAKAAGQTASLDGTQDQTFTTDANGMLTVHMDLTQFTSKNNPEPVGVGDSLEFIFELRFDDYYPEIVIVDGSLTPRDAMRSGKDIVTLTDAKNKTAKPFVAVQTISYTGRRLDVRRHTGVVGPSSNYPSAVLDSTIMLWGVEDASLTDTGYRFDLRAQETGVSVPRQKRTAPKDASFPFSSIPLVNNVVTLDSSSFVNFDGTRKTPLEAALYNGSGSLTCTIALPFGIADLTTIEKVEDAPSVTSLMANIAAYGKVGGADTEYEYVDKVSDAIMLDGLSFLEKMGSEIGAVKAVLMPTEDPTRYEAYLWTGIDTTELEDLDYDRNGICLEPHYIGEDLDSLVGEVSDTFTLSDFQAMADGSYFEDRSNLLNTAAGLIGLPVMLKLEGWMTSEIRYNFDKGQWQVLTTGGGFSAGVQLEFEKALHLTPYGIPLTTSFLVRGGALVDFQTAIRYAEQLGLEWNDDTANKVNDYLTALRINAYFEFYGGVGYDKGFTATIGVFGQIEINNENRFLTRKYLKDEKERDKAGQFLQLDGEAGIRGALGAGPLVAEVTLVSLGFGAGWPFNEWDDIDKYWEEASSGLGSAWLSDDTSGLSLMYCDDETAVLVSEPVVTLQSRDYLDEGDRVWLGGDSGISLMSLDKQNKLAAIETNSYPFSAPMLSDDGKILVYLSDADSTDVTDVEVCYSQYNDLLDIFSKGEAISNETGGFSGYGDSSLDFDGTKDFAGAIWLREASTLNLAAGTELNEGQRTTLLNGFEVVASIWNGSQWVTTRLTENGSQEFEPVIAVNGGKAIAVWRSVQTDENAFAFTQNRILCKIYNNGAWSNETYTLYNGSAGEVTGMTAEMLTDGTAAVAFSVKDENGGSDIYYTVVDTTVANPEDSAKTIRATTNTYTDENPQLTTVGNQFVLGWSSVQSLTGAEQRDVGLRVFDNTGAPKPILPESLSDMVSTAAFDGQFAFVKGADSLDELSLLWNDAKAGSEDNDVIRAIKFGLYNGSYISSAAIEVAELPARTGLTHMDARVTNDDGTSIQAVIQGTTSTVIDESDPKTYDTFDYSYKLDGEEYSVSVRIPKETVNLLSASASYSDAVEVASTMVDYTTLATESYVPVNFTVANQGMHVINRVTIQLGGAKEQTFDNLTILPGQTKTFSFVTKTGNEIRNLDYSVEASFHGGQKPKVAGTVYLDYPDVGISALTVTKEQDGQRTVLANLYNQSAASLNKSDRRVVLGVYSDPECETPLNGKYFTGGTTDKPYELILTGDTLAAIDGTGYTQEIAFHIGDYVTDAKQKDAEGKVTALKEIPDSGVTLFVKARIEQMVNREWVVLPEADYQNNQKHLTFDSLLTRSENAPTTISVEMENGSTTTANVQVRNNSLQPRTSGNLVAALLDQYGKLLETKNVGDLSLGTEEVKESSIAFSRSGARVVLRYGETASGSTGASKADATSITIDGLPLTIDSFDANSNATVENVSSGQYLLTVIPAGDGATVTVDGKPAENGIATISGGYYKRTFTVTITAKDGSTTRTYTIYLNPVPSQNSGSDDYTLHFETNGGSKITALRKSFGTTVDLTAYTPTRIGYIFTGWYADKALTEKITKVKLTGNTTVYAGWQEAAVSPFTDVPKGSYYEKAVNWAVEQGITAGTTATTFSPNNPCTRAQAVTFLWRAAGSPAPENSTMSFTDVAEGSYYHDAVLWAVENGITKGTSDTAFSPNATCTRAQIVTFLWRSQKSPASDSVNPFTDVAADAYYADAVLWAAENGVTSGTTATTFSPNNNCTRAQIVTFLWRSMK